MQQDTLAAIMAAASDTSAALANCIATLRLVDQAHQRGELRLNAQLLHFVRDSAHHAKQALDKMGEARTPALDGAALEAAA